MITFKQYLIENEVSDDKGLTEDQYNENLERHKKFNTIQHNVINTYKESSNLKFNKQLRSNLNHKDNKIKHPEKENIKHLDSIVSEPLKHDYIVYRGWNKHDAEHSHPHFPNIHEMKPGDEFTDHGYTGTTTDEDLSRNFGRWRNKTYYYTKIYVPKGTKGHFLDVGNHANNDENELLLHRGTKFRVLGHTKEGFSHITHLQAISQEPKEII